MSTTAGFYLSWLRLTGPEVKPAEVTFDPGLNVFWGASETGKSFIFTCIDFMLGRSTPPKNIHELDGYTTGWLGFIERASKKQRVLERSLKGGDFRLYAADGKRLAGVKSRDLARRARPDEDGHDFAHAAVHSGDGESHLAVGEGQGYDPQAQLPGYCPRHDDQRRADHCRVAARISNRATGLQDSRDGDVRLPDYRERLDRGDCRSRHQAGEGDLARQERTV